MYVKCLHVSFSPHLGLFLVGMALSEYKVISVELHNFSFMWGNCLRYIRYSVDENDRQCMNKSMPDSNKLTSEGPKLLMLILTFKITTILLNAYNIKGYNIKFNTCIVTNKI